MKAMILAAGFGSRLKPWTDYHPKTLAIVNGKTLLQRNIEYLQTFNITDIIINVHHFAHQIIEAIQQNNGWGSNITISDETNVVLETGGGLKKASWFFKEDFVLLNTDILTDMNLHNMILQHKENKPLATLAVSDRNTSRYLFFNTKNELYGWKNIQTGEEKPQPFTAEINDLTRKAFSGIHVINPAIFPLMHQEGKFSMIDVYINLCREHSIHYFDHSSSKFIDVGKPENILNAESLFN